MPVRFFQSPHWVALQSFTENTSLTLDVTTISSPFSRIHHFVFEWRIPCFYDFVPLFLKISEPLKYLYIIGNTVFHKGFNEIIHASSLMRGDKFHLKCIIELVHCNCNLLRVVLYIWYFLNLANKESSWILSGHSSLENVYIIMYTNESYTEFWQCMKHD